MATYEEYAARKAKEGKEPIQKAAWEKRFGPKDDKPKAEKPKPAKKPKAEKPKAEPKAEKPPEPKKEEPKAEKPAAPPPEVKKEEPKPEKAPEPPPKAKKEPKKPAKKPAKKPGLTGRFRFGPTTRKESRFAANLLKPLLASIRHADNKDAALALKEGHKALTLFRRKQDFNIEDLTDNVRKGVGLLKAPSERSQREAAKLLELLVGLEGELKKRT